MADTYNAGATGLANRSIDYAADTIKLLLLDTDVAYTFDADHATVAAILAAASELDAAGYTGGFAGAGRRTLGTKTITNDTANNRTVFDAADPAGWTLASGKTVSKAIVYKSGTSDADSIPLWHLDFTDTPTNGGDFALQFAATGIAYQQNG